MLYVAVGTLWVVSIVCILFLTTYVYRLTKRQLSAGERSYFWTISRVLIALLLGLSAFYFGVASQLESLPKLTIYRLQIREIPVWSAEAWVALSLACAVCGVLFALTDTLKNDFGVQSGFNLTLKRFNHPQLPVQVPYALTVSNQPVQPAADEYASIRYASQADQFWALANVLVGLFTGCFLFVGLQTVSQLNFVQALGIDNDFGPRMAFSERVRPTPTPTATPLADQNGGAAESSESSESGESSGSVADNLAQDEGVINEPAEQSEQRIALNTSTQAGNSEGQTALASDRGLNDAAVAIGQPTNNPQTRPSQNEDEQPSQLATEGTDTADSISPAPVDSGEASITATTPLVAIREQYGVNARSGPGLGFNVVAILANGTEHPLVGRSGDGQWFNVQLPDASTGWVASWVVEILP